MSKITLDDLRHEVEMNPQTSVRSLPTEVLFFELKRRKDELNEEMGEL